MRWYSVRLVVRLRTPIGAPWPSGTRLLPSAFLKAIRCARSSTIVLDLAYANLE